MYISGDNSFLIQQTKGVSAMETPFVLEITSWAAYPASQVLLRVCRELSDLCNLIYCVHIIEEIILFVKFF